ncbi:hypothetical protein ABZ912_48005 [Nonomuraea angiospora]|uniref:hypothetical protein n=1 Tax=Nonomuraea angiospora TaxID=46172 RepID=UPI0033D63A94
MGKPTMDDRLTSVLVTDIRTVLEKHGYRLPPGSDYIHELVMARVDVALRNLIEVFEGRTA